MSDANTGRNWGRKSYENSVFLLDKTKAAQKTKAIEFF